MRVLTCIRQEFSAAHSISSRLTEKCAVVHGHNYIVEACFTSDTPLPWVADFAQLRQLLREVIEKLDHTYMLPERLCRDAVINIPEVSSRVTCLPVEEVTTESIAVYIAKELQRLVETKLKGVRLVKVRLYETLNAYVEIELE